MTKAARTAGRQAIARQYPARILIVDDDVDFAESLSEMLDLQGYETRVASTPRETFQQIKMFAPDLALLDIRLGNDSGLDVLAKLRKSHPDIDALMLTAHASLDTAIKAVRHGAYDYLRKPIEKNELIVALERCLEKRRLERDNREAADALAQSEAHFRATFEQAAAGIALMTVDGRFEQVNHKLCDILGYTPEEMLKISFQDVTHPDDLDDTAKVMKALLAGKQAEQVLEKQCICKDQKTAWINFTISLVRDATGTPESFLTVAEDITERKRTEEALRESEARLRLLSDSLPVGISYIDTEHRYRFANKTYGEWHGVDPDKIVGKTTREVLGDEAIKITTPRIDRTLAGGTTNLETRIPYKNAGTLDVQVIGVPHFDENGKILGAYGMVLDITERKKAEAKAIEAHHRLSDAIESISEGFILYDADERLVLCNATYRAMCPQIADILKPGVKLEDVLRASFEREIFQKTGGNTDEWVRNRLIQYRTKQGTIEQTLTDGRRVLVMESRTSEGGSVGIRTDITELKRTEYELREREERIRSILDNVADGVISIDMKGKIESFNAAAERMFGYRAEEIIGRAVSKLMTGTDRRLHSSYVNNYLASGMGKVIGVNERELTGRRKNGSKFPLSLSLGEMRAGSSRFFIGSLRDISARKQAEAAIEASKRKAAEAHALLAEAIESSPDAIGLYDADDRLILFNDAFKSVIFSGMSDVIEPGVSFEELVRTAVDRGLFMVPDGDVEDYVSARIKNHRAGAGNLEVEMEGGRWMLSRERRMPGGGIIGTRTDITEQKRTEIAIRESEERFRAVIDNSPMTFLLKDTEGRVQLANQTYINWFGPPLAELVGKTSHELFSKEIADAFVAQDRKALETGEVFELEHEIAFKDGSLHSIVVTKFPVFDGNGLPIGVAGMSSDVTEQRKTEEQLRHAQKMEAVGQLTGGVAHDFNNLLTVILGNLDLLSDIIKDDPVKNELIDAAIQASLRSADLTQQLLAFSRKQTLSPQPVDVNGRLPVVIGLMKRTLGENIDVETGLAARLPKAMVDESQLENAILNLAINARDAMPTGGRLTIATDSLTIRKSGSGNRANLTPGRYITLSVSDTGTGMSPDVIEHALEPFFTTKEVGEGSGLGLSMVYGFVRQSGGDLEIRSELGKGTTIVLLLPVAKEKTNSQDNSRQTPSGFPTGTETVLVVEDQPQVRSFIVTVLRRLGYTVFDASNGVEALALAKKTPTIDLVLTDLILPGGINGHEIAQQLRKRIARTKVVYISGYSRDTIDSGDSSTFLMKPFGRKDLAETVRMALDAVNA